MLKKLGGIFGRSPTFKDVVVEGSLTMPGGVVNTGASLVADADGTLTANSDLKVATQKAVKTYVDTSVVGLLDLKGGIACAANPNYPAALKGDTYMVTSAGKVGGASGIAVDVGDAVIASADNAGGTQAAVGASWFILERNLTGVMLTTNNLSDVANVATARSNLGLGTAAVANSTDFAVAAKGVTNGDSHDHNGGDGAQIAYSSLYGLPTLGSMASQNANSVAVTGGAIDGTPVGATTSSTGKFNSVAIAAVQNVITGGMWYQTGGGLLVMTPATTGGFAWNNYANNAQIGSLSNDGALTIKNNFLLDGAGNPQHIVKTSGAGNNPLYRLQADTNYWDMIGVFSDADDTYRVRYNNTDYLQINNAGNVTVNSGNLIIGTSGKGIDFSVTSQAGGMTSELLADYEEGTFTPYMNADSGGQLPGATTGSGKYVKVGNVVTITGSVTWSSVSSGYAGAARIYGLPFNPADVGTVPKGFNGFATASYDSYQLQTSARLDPSTGGSSGVVNISNFTSGGTMYFNFSYRV